MGLRFVAQIAHAIRVNDPDGNVNPWMTALFGFLLFFISVVALMWIWARLSTFGVENLGVLSFLAGCGVILATFFGLCVAQAASGRVGVLAGIVNFLVILFLFWLGTWHLECTRPSDL